MKKVLIYLLPLALLCIVSLTGCSLFDEKEKETSKQTSTEENLKDKESESEEKSKASKDGTEKSNVEKAEASKQASLSKENSTPKPKEAPKQATATSQVDWGDAWTRDIQFRHGLLKVTDKSADTFKFRIDATYSFDADAVRRGAVNFGEIEGTAKIQGNVATQTAPDPYTKCQMKFVNHTTYVEVITLNACSPGGFNVYFDGDYKKGNIPEKEIPMEDDQVENDESTEDASGVDEDNWEDEDTNQVDEDNWEEDDTETNNSEEETSSEVSVEEAQKLVEDYVDAGPDNFTEYDHEENGSYIFSYYVDGEETASLLGMYGVNLSTKQVYKVQ
ncbi:hypothetical protein [Priestia megaterium]|uniref:hypothetical protein n=1 Tax=Priestia megaterium TaxID=1404 RepID=UPI002E1EA7DF|nr:hypothetical protein [Priestia megaterium]